MEKDVIVIGGGQSGLAVGYYLRRTNLSFAILDAAPMPGGAWQYMWHSLRLFSPAQWSSLPGVIMPGGGNYYPCRDEVLQYLKAYEERYQLPVERPVTVCRVEKSENGFLLQTSAGNWRARAVVAATGFYQHPFIPTFAATEKFQGKLLHSSAYQNAEPFRGQRVAIVGEGNSGAQILAEVSRVATTLWITAKEPRFLPDEVDGRYLFDAATQMYNAKMQGKTYQPPSLGDVVMVPSVKDARQRNVLHSVRPFKGFTTYGLLWDDGHEEKVDAVIFCTGFKPVLNYLPANWLDAEGRVATVETKARYVEGLWLVGFGHWTGFASATLIGVGRSAKKTVEEIETLYRSNEPLK
ncbi:MAG: ArsO family NAD(P)H-dependent flavin-containing monooxygenase [Bacteroidota bacterium]